MSLSSLSFDGTVQAHALVETNAQRYPRPVVVKLRKLGGRRGKVVRMAGRIPRVMAFFDDSMSAKEFSDISSEINNNISHWAVQVGGNLWELHTDSKHANTLQLQRLSGDQIWTANVLENQVGQTRMTDKELNIAANDAFDVMKTRNGGKYHMLDNNCKDYVELFLREILPKEVVDKMVANDYFRE